MSARQRTHDSYALRAVVPKRVLPGLVLLRPQAWSPWLLSALAAGLPDGWRKPESEAARFEAFRSLPQETQLSLLAYDMALMLQPKLALPLPELTDGGHMSRDLIGKVCHSG